MNNEKNAATVESIKYGNLTIYLEIVKFDDEALGVTYPLIAIKFHIEPADQPYMDAYFCVSNDSASVYTTKKGCSDKLSTTNMMHNIVISTGDMSDVVESPAGTYSLDRVFLWGLQYILTDLVFADTELPHRAVDVCEANCILEVLAGESNIIGAYRGWCTAVTKDWCRSSDIASGAYAVYGNVVICMPHSVSVYAGYVE